MQIIDTMLVFNGRLTKRNRTGILILHHADAENASAETVHSWHVGRGWAGMGYNFYVRKNGLIYKGRGWDMVGSHCAGYNSTSIGICFEGRYDSVDKQMPPAQYNAGVWLIGEALRRYPSITEICGHKKYGATACPGRYFPLAGLIADGKGNQDNVSASTESAPPVSKSENVNDFQSALNADGIRDSLGRPLKVDGIYGTNTSAAAKKILLKSGIWNDEKNRYMVGSRGEVVRWSQKRLNILMGINLVPDGKFGNDTREAVEEWQRRNGLTVDGIIGVDTATSLL